MLRRITLALPSLLLAACPGGSTPDGGAAAPIVTSVSPDEGPTSGGTAVSVNGVDFRPGATVSFGDVPALGVSVESGTRLTATTPAVASPGVVTVRVRNADGTEGALPGAFRYREVAALTVAEAVLLNPAEASDSSGATSIRVDVSASVEVPGVTAGAGQGRGVRAQVGFATALSSPPVATDFSWIDAAYQGDADGLAAGAQARDVYAVPVMLPGAMSGAVTYALAARFSVNGGDSWTLADRDGAANGVSAAHLAHVTVEPASVDWCKLGGQAVEAPPVVNLREGQAGPIVYGQVYARGVTDRVGRGAAIRGQLGVGAPGTPPAGWTWTDATFNVDTGNGANDEYQATLPALGVGSARFAFRFNRDDGPWAYCDADGLATGGFTEAQAGTVNVDVVSGVDCRLQSVSSFSTTSGAPVGVTVRVRGAPLDGGAPQPRVQVGVGTQGDNASLSAAWGWQDSVATGVASGELEYQRRIFPAYTGTRAVSARASVDDGGTWTYCDLNGSDVNGYEVTQQYDVLVGPHADFDFCNLQFPPTADAGVAIFGQVYEPGLTPSSSADLSAWLGLGQEAEDPGLAYRWVPAPYFGQSGNNNEHRALLPPSARPDERYVFRFTRDGGSFCYGDLDGSQNGFSGGANIGRVVP